MGFGGPIGLIVVGLILALAFNQQQVGPLEVTTLGWILVLAGALWLVLTLVQQNTKRQPHHDRHHHRRRRAARPRTQRTTESDPPAPPAV